MGLWWDIHRDIHRDIYIYIYRDIHRDSSYCLVVPLWVHGGFVIACSVSFVGGNPRMA